MQAALGRVFASADLLRSGEKDLVQLAALGMLSQFERARLSVGEHKDSRGEQEEAPGREGKGDEPADVLRQRMRVIASRLEVHALRISLRILTMLVVSSHGMGLSEAHVCALLESELPPAAAGSVLTLACQHVRQFAVQCTGAWTIPHTSTEAALRPLLLQNGSGFNEHAELAHFFLRQIDPKKDGSFTGAVGRGRGGSVAHFIPTRRTSTFTILPQGGATLPQRLHI